MAIRFHTEDVRFNWKSKRMLSRWIKDAALEMGRTVTEINVILCSDDFLLKMNRQFLEHDYFTDIISFDYSHDTLISGDLYISLDRVNDNANTMNVNKLKELYRVVIHGVLHLCGQGDKSKTESEMMRKLEDRYLNLLFSRIS